ncbi:MAG TPA: hypothetical protein VI432_01800 [Candidatus Paceibacterota bacterium]
MLSFIKYALAQNSIARDVAASAGFDLANIFQWAIGVGAILAVGVMIFGGVKYTAAVGNPSIQTDAKEWIKGAVFGLLLLIGAYLILNTINPGILKF